MPSIITVNNLSKKFVIAHEGKEKYEMLSQQIGNHFKNIFTKNKQNTTNYKEDFWALKDVNFELKHGERLGIIGRNGAGKSTLLKVLSRITHPTTGSISIKGRVASLLEVGTGFHPELTGRENVFLNGAILGMSRAEIKKKFDEIVAFAEVENFLDTPVKRYSSGMYVRLAFAVAAHLEPEILIVDEVLAVGDAQFQKKCLGKMEDVSKEGRTVLFVSHNMSTIKSLCSSILYLKNGEIVTQGAVEETIKKYLAENQQIIAAGNIPRNIHRKYNNGKAFIDAIQFLNNENIATNNFNFGENFKIELTFTVEKQLEPCTIQFVITTQSGENVMSINHCNNGVYQFKEFAIGTHKVTVNVNAKLLPLGFNISAFISNQKGTPIDFVEHIAPFSVSNINTKQGADYPWGVVYGYTEHNANYNY